MPKRLLRQFYCQPTLEVARQLLGKILVRKISGKNITNKPRGESFLLRGRIVETEAYLGPQDKASHAFGGRMTNRNQAEYLAGGYIYIYLVYGMYWQFNISTFKEGKPECVLIRALEPIGLPDKKLANGPGKLCRWLKLDKSFYGEDLTKSKKVWLENSRKKITPLQIAVSRRIGIDYAGPYWANRKLRFYLKNNEFISGQK